MLICITFFFNFYPLILLFLGRFGDVPIQDLFMSRQERRKIKKEQKEQQKNKKKDKNKNVVNSAGDWNIEDIKIGDSHKEVSQNDDENDDLDANDHDLNSQSVIDHNEEESDSEDEMDQSDDENTIEQSVDENVIEQSDDDNEIEQSNDEVNDDESDNQEQSIGMFVKLKPSSEVPIKLDTKVHKPINKQTIQKEDKARKKNRKEQKISVSKEINTKTAVIQKTKPIQNKNLDKKDKNKNLKEKLQTRKFKKDISDDVSNENKVVDSFFITASGENYLSLAEPRQPDEVKEIHKQGNRKERRAAMFGHVPKIKPRRDDSRQHFNSKDKRNFDTNSNNYYKDNTNFKSKNTFGNNKERFNNNPKSNGKHTKFNDDHSSFNNSKYNKTNDKNLNDSRSVEKQEKLHPSWEAKKKQSSNFVPFQGKKIVFDES